MKRYIRSARLEPLYHGTDFKSAYLILDSNQLRANISNETETYGVSFTRNFREAYSEVVFVVDQEKLSYNYSIHPLYRDGIAGRDLAEERVDRTITDFRKYIIEARLSHPIFIRILAAKLRKIDDINLLSDPSINSEIYYANKFLDAAFTYGVPLDRLLIELRDRISEWIRNHENRY